jgi:carboxylesterase type B
MIFESNLNTVSIRKLIHQTHSLRIVKMTKTAAHTFLHPALGKLIGLARDNLIHFNNIPYGKISQRFARATLIEELASHNDTSLPPASIQPLDSGKMDCKGNQFPAELMDGYVEEQSEDCLNLNVIVPNTATPTSSLPVLVFVHGGAFFIGASTRPYYDPSTMIQEAIRKGTPHVFVSMNYRLGGLGFFHSPEAQDLMPANNGLHDQRIGFEWIRRFIGDFGGDADNITAMGQSAGGMSMTIHNLSGHENVWKRSIQFSGSLVTMPAKTPQEHQENFLAQAEKLDISTASKASRAIAQEMISLPVSKIRDLNYVGLPCTSSTLLPYSSASMATMLHRRPQSPNLQSQILSSTTYDGGISYNLMITNPSLSNHAQKFTSIVHNTPSLSPKGQQTLLNLYSITSSDSDAAALRKICQFESDIGFFAASYAQARAFQGKSYLLLFDLGNPFSGHLPAGECATHTWDIVALLGSCEGRPEIDDEYKAVISEFREKVLRYVCSGEEPWEAWTEKEGKAMLVGKDGLRVIGKEEYVGRDTRRGKLMALAEEEAGEDGADLLWDGVCRRFLMGG